MARNIAPFDESKTGEDEAVAGYILQVEDLTKEFPGVVALDRVSLNVKQGEIHAVIGENGAGKSTLMKVLSGVYPHGTYEGRVIIDGVERHFRNVRESEEVGIAIIYQELLLVKQLSIAENIFLGTSKADRLGVINWDQVNHKAGEWLHYVGLEEPPTTIVGDLGLAKQQLVEITKALSKDARILILDEPTAALSENEVVHLANILRELKQKGVTSIYISHKIQEVLQLSDTVTILRDGKTVHTAPTAELNERRIVSMMVGREFSNRFPERKRQKNDQVILDVKNWSLTRPGSPGQYTFEDVSFQLHRGEILGIAGLMGAGRTELVNSLFGIYHGSLTGELSVVGRKVRIRSPEDAIRSGIGLLTEDRKRFGLNLVGSIKNNISMASTARFSNHGYINEDEEIRECEKHVDNLKIKITSLNDLVSKLSGGNQQKVILARWLMVNPTILLVDEPTRGIDVGTKYEIYLLMDALLQNGIGIVMVTSELPEALAMSDRVLVMREGRIVKEFDYRNLTEESIMNYATGSEEE
jgi:D-xylose transport system ATP-binding protein